MDLIIPEGTTIIKDFAFCNNKNIDIKSINIPDSVETIGKYVFSGCNYVESIITPFVGADRNGETNAYVGICLVNKNTKIMSNVRLCLIMLKLR